MTKASVSDLVALVADRDIEEVVNKLLGRPRALNMRRIRFTCSRHPNRDSGCRGSAGEVLRPFQRSYRHALVIFDRHGCGSSEPRQDIESEVEDKLARSGWDNRGRAVVIDPELEAWVWADSASVASSLGWKRGYASLRSWLTEQDLWDAVRPKPARPKEAMRRVLSFARKRRSARVFGELADSVSTVDCRDPAFQKLRSTLQEWFPPGV